MKLAQIFALTGDRRVAVAIGAAVAVSKAVKLFRQMKKTAPPAGADKPILALVEIGPGGGETHSYRFKKHQLTAGLEPAAGEIPPPAGLDRAKRSETTPGAPKPKRTRRAASGK